MPTLVGGAAAATRPRASACSPSAIGVSKSDSWIDYSVLEDCMREHLNEVAPRRIAVLDPVKLVIDNYPSGQREECYAPNHPQKPDWGKRAVPFSRELWIEREDFMETPSKGYFRLFPGKPGAAAVRLRRAVHRLFEGRTPGKVTAVHCEYMPDTKSGTPGAEARQGEGQRSIGCQRAAGVRDARCGSTIACSRSPHPGAATANLPAGHQSGCEEGHHGASSSRR